MREADHSRIAQNTLRPYNICMRLVLVFSLLLFLQSCSCSKQDTAESGGDMNTFDGVWEKYHLLCNYNIANATRCNELQERLDAFGPDHMSEKTLQTLVGHCTNEKARSACVILSWYFYRKGKWTNVIKFGKDHCPDSPAACFYVGDSYTNMNNLSEALPYLENACLKEEAAGCERIGHFYLGEQKYEGAVKYFRRACDLEEAYGCYNLACAYSLMKNADMAYNALEQALEWGFEDWATLQKDKDLSYLKSKKDVQALIDAYNY